MKIEQLTGLPVLTIKPDRAKLARYGLNIADVQDVVAVAVGGRNAGTIFEGDRRFELQVRLPEQLRGDIESLKRLPIGLPTIPMRNTAEGPAAAPHTYMTLGEVARFEVVQGPNQVSRENGKRRAVVTANVRDRDLGSFVSEAEALIAKKVRIPPGYWTTWGGQFEQLILAAQRLQIVVPVALGLVFLLLHGMLGNFRDSLLVFTQFL